MNTTGWTPPPTAPTVKTKLEDCRSELERLEIEAKEAGKLEFWRDLIAATTSVTQAINKLSSMADRFGDSLAEYDDDNGVAPQPTTPPMPYEIGEDELIF